MCNTVAAVIHTTQINKKFNSIVLQVLEIGTVTCILNNTKMIKTKQDRCINDDSYRIIAINDGSVTLTIKQPLGCIFTYC